MSNQQESPDSIRRRLLEADSLLLASLFGHDEVSNYAAQHHLLIQKLNDGYFEAALNDLVNAGRRLEPDGKALPREFWSTVAAAADSLGLNGRATDLRENAGG